MNGVFKVYPSISRKIQKLEHKQVNIVLSKKPNWEVEEILVTNDDNMTDLINRPPSDILENGISSGTKMVRINIKDLM